MRLSFIFIFAALMQVSASSSAQKVTLIQNNARLTTVLDEIRKQTGYDFVYSDKVMNTAKRVSLNLKNTELQEALEICFRDQPLSFKVEDKMVIIKPKEEPSFIENIIARFQAIDVRGKVVDSLGNGLAGATISVKNRKGSTNTAANGDFYLKNVEEDAVLVISIMGYITNERAANKDFMYIQLQQSTSKLDEVQVIAYGTTSRRLSTGSVFTIKAEEISNQPVNNPLYALQGRVPNLIVQPTSGVPGAPIGLQLRGQNSLAGSSTEPLIIINGVPVQNNISGPDASFPEQLNTNALTFINPDDIESIDILSDADATSLYGSRGGNGVILITTKKASVGETKINVKFSSAYSQISKKIKMLNTSQYLEMRNEAFKNDSRIPQIRNRNSARDYAPDLLLWDQSRYTDWQEEIFGGSTKNVDGTLGISGGNSTIQYLINGNYNRQKYFTPGDNKFETGRLHFSLTGSTANQKFRSTLTGSYSANSSVKSKGFDWSQILTLAPNAPSPYNSYGELNWETNPNLPPGTPTWTNPYAAILNMSEGSVKTLRVSNGLEYRPIKELMIKLDLGFSEINTASKFSNTLASMDPLRRQNATGSTSYTDSFFSSWSVDPQVIFNKHIGKGNLNLLFGGAFQAQFNNSDIENYLGYIDDDFLKNKDAATSSNGFNSTSDYKYIAGFGRLGYNWNDTYLINLSARRDGSSRFGPGRQFGTFWSVGAGYILTNSVLRENIPSFISFGKFRGSYGSSGNDGIGDYQYLELFQIYRANQSTQTTYQDILTTYSRGVTNPAFSWEDVRKAEIGVDIGFFRDRILLSGSLWQTRSSNQLGQIRLPFIVGATDLIINQPAKIQNNGLDILFNAKLIVAKKFTWQSNLNFGIQRNRLLSLPDAFNSDLDILQYYKSNNINPVGNPFSGISSVKEFRGVDPETGIYLFANKEGISVDALGAYTYAKLITSRPKYSGGLSNNISFQRFHLDLFIQFTKQNGKNYLFDNTYSNVGNSGAFSNGYGNKPIEAFKRWQKFGDDTPFQRFTSNPFNQVVLSGLQAASTSNIGWVDASFLRVKTIAISYDVPNRFNKYLGIRNSSIRLNGQNLWTITKYKGVDPETQSAGTLPPLRTISFGLNVGL